MSTSVLGGGGGVEATTRDNDHGGSSVELVDDDNYIVDDDDDTDDTDGTDTDTDDVVDEASERAARELDAVGDAVLLLVELPPTQVFNSKYYYYFAMSTQQYCSHDNVYVEFFSVCWPHFLGKIPTCNPFVMLNES